jgi:hypothetical protein
VRAQTLFRCGSRGEIKSSGRGGTRTYERREHRMRERGLSRDAKADRATKRLEFLRYAGDSGI